MLTTLGSGAVLGYAVAPHKGKQTGETALFRQLVDLYLARWHVELDLRSIKCLMKMDVLRCKTPEMVRKDITVHLLVYNLIRTLMAQAATELKKQAREMSFKAAQETIQEFHVLLLQAEISLLPKLIK